MQNSQAPLGSVFFGGVGGDGVESTRTRTRSETTPPAVNSMAETGMKGRRDSTAVERLPRS